jgi:hypothetical protein
MGSWTIERHRDIEDDNEPSPVPLQVDTLMRLSIIDFYRNIIVTSMDTTRLSVRLRSILPVLIDPAVLMHPVSYGTPTLPLLPEHRRAEPLSWRGLHEECTAVLCLTPLQALPIDGLGNMPVRHFN